MQSQLVWTVFVGYGVIDLFVFVNIDIHQMAVLTTYNWRCLAESSHVLCLISCEFHLKISESTNMLILDPFIGILQWRCWTVGVWNNTEHSLCPDSPTSSCSRNAFLGIKWLVLRGLCNYSNICEMQTPTHTNFFEMKKILTAVELLDFMVKADCLVLEQPYSLEPNWGTGLMVSWQSGRKQLTPKP